LKTLAVWRISRPVSIPRLFAILVAVAMLFAPVAMQSGSAMAAMPSDHHSEMTSSGHCGGQPAKHDGQQRPDMPCCAAMCAPSVLPTQAGSELLPFASLAAVPDAPAFPRGVLSEISTPPPRVS